MSSQSVDIDSTLETLEAMRRQEERGYIVTDYLSQIPATAALEAPVDAVCRQVMAKWCVDIADFCNYSRDTTCVAMSMLDRFMASDPQMLLDRNLFQLAAMTALYTAVKIHEHEAMDPNLVAQLSRGAHSAQAVEAMEQRMLTAIQWRVNPPTAMSFVKNLLDLVPDCLMDSAQRETVLDLTQLQVDLAVQEYAFSQYPASSIAFASLLNAVESVTTDDMFFRNFESTMSSAVQIELPAMRNIRISLYEAVNGGPDDMDISPCHNSSGSMCEDMKMYAHGSHGSIHTSPRSVSA